MQGTYIKSSVFKIIQKTFFIALSLKLKEDD